MHSWNPVLNKFIKIKSEFLIRFGEDILWDYNPEVESCLEYWANMLPGQKEVSLLNPLIINECGDLLLVRYGRYADVFSGEVSPDEFWQFEDGFYTECRSVVINKRTNELVLTPFKKFRNLNECEATSYENVLKRIESCKTFEVSEKLDGSMQSARWYNGKVVLAGSQALDAEKSFRLKKGYELIRKNWNYELMMRSQPNWTFIFELIVPEDDHVVKYSEEQSGLYLIGIRDVISGKEYNYYVVKKIAEFYGVPTTVLHKKTLDEIMGELDDKRSDEAEGFVLNIDGFKVKIKYNDYVMMHGILSTLSSVNMIIRAIADNCFDDFISKVPDAYKDRIYDVANEILVYQRTVEQEIQNYFEDGISSAGNKEISRKEFMVWVDQNVPVKYRGYVRAKFLGASYNVLKTSTGKYIKMKEVRGENG